ncbi:hypothetical protein BCR43DRAFT_517840 [Syncephalastrum racemosum]|uniref:Uncharacterized protein n=1 Tax=Syncephalastrum racemosum TaxID=13706 RepID=A0A1X2H5H9_SYNRA|nr:hypothetical protein BCR43DRAFT_517840 [Syncephalastrum racemosum]
MSLFHSNDSVRSIQQQETLLRAESVLLAMPEEGIEQDQHEEGDESDSELERYFSTSSPSVLHKLAKTIKDKLAYLLCILLWLLATAVHFVCGFIAEKLWY